MDQRKRVGGSVSVGIAGWLIGILIASIFPKTNVYINLMPIVNAIGIFLWPSTKKKPVVFLVMLSLALFRFSYTEEKINQEIAKLPFEQNVELSGLVTVSSDAGDNGSQFVVKGTLGKDKENIKTKEEIKFQIRDSNGKSFDYGDVVTISGKLEKPEPFETTSGTMFDYASYLKKDGVLGIVKAKTIRITDSKKGNAVLRVLYGFNSRLEDITKTLIPGMNGSLSSGVLLGDKQITKENRQEFITTGTTHIIALSGYNVSIVSNFFRELFSFLPLVGALAMGGLAILLFVTMTGLQSSAVRAGIMALIVLFAKSKGRSADIGLVILLSAFVMTVINPYTLYYDVSAQLSYLATVGIIYFSPRIAHWFIKVPEKKFGIPWREMLTGTIGTQIFVLPFLLFKTGTLSLISPITNIVVLPFVPYLMSVTTIVALIGALYLPLALPFALLAKINASIILSIIHYSTKIPLAAVPLKISLVAMLVIYGMLFYIFDPFGWRKLDK